jgi:FkbM family methyltransferase
MQYSIIIPTYNHCNDLLKPCIESIIAYSTLSNIEIIVSANGCTDNTAEYLQEVSILFSQFGYPEHFSYTWHDKPLGYARAINRGIRMAKTNKIIVLNNDLIFLPQPTDVWIQLLEQPFIDDPMCGISGPTQHYSDAAGTEFLILYCAMIDRKVFDTIGLFNEQYTIGCGEDIELCIEAKKAGFSIVACDNQVWSDEANLFIGQFPIYHKGEGTVHDPALVTDWNNTYNKNMFRLAKKYNPIWYKDNYRPSKRFSIVIPTYNHCDDLLKPCLESIIQYTDLSECEVLIVANGCTDNTYEYVKSLGHPFRIIWYDEPLGYPNAANHGILEADGEYVILLNNDIELLPQEKNTWINLLYAPFTSEGAHIGITGPFKLHCHYANRDFLMLFCAMIPRTLFDNVGLYDEIFSPGGGEDVDFCARVENAGYSLYEIGTPVPLDDIQLFSGPFPIWHKGNRTLMENDQYQSSIIKEHGLINCKRYNKDIRLNIGAGGKEIPGYISVDLYDTRASIMADITELDFNADSVDEILGYHVFEHLNPYKVRDTLTNWLRVLKPGGKVILEMPNIEELCINFEKASKSKRYELLNCIYGSVNTTGIGGNENITSPHLFGWYPEILEDDFRHVGFERIEFPPIHETHHWGYNFRIEASKPRAVITIDYDYLIGIDLWTYQEIFLNNSYGVMQHEIMDKTVIDVGANCGFFTILCVTHHAKQIYAIEAQPLMYEQYLVPHTANFQNVTPLNYAVYNTDGEIVKIPNNGLTSCVGEVGDEVSTIQLATLLSMYNIEGNDLVLKMDCEGSEFNILLTCEDSVLKRFAIIYIEVHGSLNKNPEYQNTLLIHGRLSRHFNCISSIPMVTHIPTKGPVATNVRTEKWIRK